MRPHARDDPSPQAHDRRNSGRSSVRRGIPATQRAPRAGRRAPRRNGSLKDIKHVVILMQENRSFDHYFGTLPGVRGFADPDAISSAPAVGLLPARPAEPRRYLLPFHLDTRTTSAQAIPSTSHAWAVQHVGLERRQDGQLAARPPRGGRRRTARSRMGYYKREDIPFQFALAEAFTICDNYHCSVMGPTWPNRLYCMTGTIDPRARRRPDHQQRRSRRLTLDDLCRGARPTRASAGRSTRRWTTTAATCWRCSPASRTPRSNSHAVPSGMRTFRAGPVRVRRDPRPAADGVLDRPDQQPVRASGLHAGRRRGLRRQQDRRHRGQPGRLGQDGLHPQLRRERRPVRPRPAAHPAGRHARRVRRRPAHRRRVPRPVHHRLAVDPGGWVCSETFDHTSVLQFLENLTGVAEPNITAWRRKTFGDLTSAFGFPVNAPFPAPAGDQGPARAGGPERQHAARAGVPDGQPDPPTQETGPRPRPRGSSS